MAKNYMSKFMKYTDMVRFDYDPHAHVSRTPSPSMNFIFGNGHGLPQGYTAVLYGKPKGGKTIILNAMTGQRHADDPEAWVIKFNTERRELIQNTPRMLRAAGIDLNRYVCFETKQAAGIFDRIEKDLAAMIDDGCKITDIIIDSISSIQGLRDANADSVEKNQIGDQAHTIQKGLGRILDVIRDRKIALWLTAQVRAEMDQTEQMRGNSVKMQSAFATKHFAEYFIYLERDETKDGRVNLLGEEYTDESKRDVRLAGGKGELTGHNIRVTMKENSCGPRGRQGRFTFNYSKGIVNVHEEVFLLGVARGIIQRPSNSQYVVGETKWTGQASMLQELERNTELQQHILKELRRQDLEGLIPEETAAADAAPAVDLELA